MCDETDMLAAKALKQIYETNFAGKINQRYLITRNQIREIYDFSNLHHTRIDRLAEAANQLGFCLWDMEIDGDGIHYFAVVKRKNVKNWRKVTKSAMRDILFNDIQENNEEENDDDDYE